MKKVFNLIRLTVVVKKRKFFEKTKNKIYFEILKLKTIIILHIQLVKLLLIESIVAQISRINIFANFLILQKKV